MKTLRQINVEISNLEHEAVISMKHQYPIGSFVEYCHGDQIREVHVIDHNPYHPRLLVMGFTGKQYWLDADRCITDGIIDEPNQRNPY